MPFNGSGVYVRTENWTNDANNDLPISATKFDTEAADMASAFGLCLTRDGQGGPTAPLTWSQMLTVNMAADGASLVAGRSGGTNNPQIQLKLADASGGIVNLTTAQALALAIQGTNVITVNASSVASAQPISASRASDGNVLTLSRTGGANNPSLTLAVTDATQAFAFSINGTSALSMTTSAITAGAYVPTSATVPTVGIYLPAANNIGFSTASTQRGFFNSNGSFVVNTPSTGPAIQAGGAYGGAFSPQLSVTAPTATTASIAVRDTADATEAVLGANSTGIYLGARTNAQLSFLVGNATKAQILPTGEFQVLDDGGSMQDVGYRGTPLNTISASRSLALTDRGKMVNTGTNGITVTAAANVFSASDVVAIRVAAGASITIAQGVGVTMQWANGTNTTGNRTITGEAIATIIWLDAIHCTISGSGVS